MRAVCYVWLFIGPKFLVIRIQRGLVSALDDYGRIVWMVDAHGYGKRFIVCADEMLTAFLELESAIHEFAVSLMS